MTDPRVPATLTCDEVRDLAAPFVLGALDATDAAAVREHLASCDDAHAEFDELGSMLPVLDASVPVVEPPASLKTRLMAAAAADLETRPATAMTPAAMTPATVAPAIVVAPVVPAAPTPFPSAEERTARAARRTSTLVWVVRIAAVLVIGVLAAWNLSLQGQLDDSDRYQQNVAAVLDVAAQPGSLTAILATPDGSGPAGLAAISAQGDVSLAMHDLDPTSGNQVYEAWVIGSDGVPVPLGSFAVGGGGTAYFQGSGLPTEAGITLALTKEPGPGATTPTLPIVSSGTASAAG